MRVFNINVTPVGWTLLTKTISGFIERLSTKVKRLNVICATSKQLKVKSWRTQENGPWRNPLQMWPMRVWNKSKEIPYLQVHTKRDHEGQVFQCKHCEYSSKARQLLKRHISVVHEGIKYNCDQCAYIVTSSKSLKRNMSENVHNVQACSQCNQLFDDPKRFVRLLFVCLLFC